MINNYFKKEDKLLIANIMDKYKKYKKTGICTYTNFINSVKLDMITKYLDNLKVEYNVYKPYDFLDKGIIYFGEYNNYITFYKANITDIKHSDILGTLFNLGLDTDLIGDIIVEDGYFYYTNLTRINDYIINSLTIIKNEPIKLEVVDEIILNKEHTKTIEIIINSMRLDNIISRLTNLSRSDSTKLINDKMVLINLEEPNRSNIIIKKGDILSIRKYGRYKISSIKRKTNKDKIILEIIKYI